MSTAAFGLGVLVTALAGVVAVLSSRVSERLRIPAPAFFLIAAAAAADLWPRLGGLSFTAVDQIVSVALAVILFDGGMRVGWRRMKSVAGPTLWIGVAGTLVTAGGVAVLARLILALDWRSALLLGAALAPTDPAVLFSVLGRREVAGRGGALLEGESGSNDPVGIALLAALLAASGTGMTAVGHVAIELLAQLIIGTAVGAAGGWALLAFMRRVPLPSESLYPLRVLAGALAIYGAATAVHGSGFLAVFVAGILIGDERAPYQREIVRFHSALASLGEIVAFIMLGLTIRLHDLAAPLGLAGWLGTRRAAVAGRSAAAGRGVVVAGAPASPGAAVRAVGRPQGRGADPARRVHRPGRGSRRAPALRDHLRSGGVLGHRAGRHGAVAAAPAEDPAAHHRAGAVEPRHPVPARARGPAPLHRGARRGR